MIDTQKDLLIESIVGRNKYWGKVRENMALFLIVIFLISLVISLLFYLLPLKAQIDSLQLEKRHWVAEISSGTIPDPKSEMPTFDKLPLIIELCQNCLSKNGVKISSFNVERFSEKQESLVPVSLDYANLRMHFRGTWQEIEAGLNELEHMNKLAIQVQEVVLTPAGGETLLRIYMLNS
ncbi:MAG: hypothetical protein ACYDEJ_00170 [Desulfitobacteriaceae bacterium]